MTSELLLNYGGVENSYNRVITVNQTLRPFNKNPLADPHKSFLNAVSEPSGEVPLVEKISKAKKIAIIIGDRRKIDQQVTVLRFVLELLKNHDPRKIALFLASANRGKLTLEDIKLPVDIIERYQFISHDSRDESRAIYVGITRSNTDVRINRELLSFDLKIGIDTIRPHLFAGYTGGGQIILPGLSYYKTIESNHSMRVKEKCVLGNREDNIVKKDMNEAAELIDNLFVINSILTRDDEFYGFVAGTPTGAFEQGVKIAKSIYSVPARKTDIVIVTGGAQFTTNRYQAGKLIGAAGKVLQSGGIVILLAKCQNGAGNQEEFLNNIYHKSLVNYLPRDHKIFLVSDLPEKALENTIYTPFSALESAQRTAQEILGKKATLTVLHNSEYLIPEVE